MNTVVIINVYASDRTVRNLVTQRPPGGLHMSQRPVNDQFHVFVVVSEEQLRHKYIPF